MPVADWRRNELFLLFVGVKIRGKPHSLRLNDLQKVSLSLSVLLCVLFGLGLNNLEYIIIFCLVIKSIRLVLNETCKNKTESKDIILCLLRKNFGRTYLKIFRRDGSKFSMQWKRCTRHLIIEIGDCKTIIQISYLLSQLGQALFIPSLAQLNQSLYL